MQLCFATVIRGSARLTLGKKDQARGIEWKGRVLTSRDVSSLVIDKLCDQARGRNVAVACVYFDFAARREQSSIRILGALLKQVVGGLGEIPEEISEAYEDQKKVIGGRGPQLLILRRCCGRPRLKGLHSSASTQWMNVHQNIESRSLIRCIKSSKSLRAFEYS